MTTRRPISALTKVIDEANQIGQPFFAVDASVHLADAYTRSGDPLRALKTSKWPKIWPERTPHSTKCRCSGCGPGALIVMGRPEEALGHIEPALASAREQRLVYEEALLLTIKAETGVDDGEALEEANRLLDELGASDPNSTSCRRRCCRRCRLDEVAPSIVT